MIDGEQQEPIAQPTDAELFSTAMADEKAPAPETGQTAEVAKTEADSGQPRDEAGRFAPKQADAAAAPIQQQPAKDAKPEQPEDGAQVPSWRLRELREQREAAERRAQDFESNYRTLERQNAELLRRFQEATAPKQESVDIFTDPEAAIRQHLTPLEQRYQTLESKLTLRASKAENFALHGREVMAELDSALDTAMRANHPDMPLLSQQMRKSDDPVGVAMQWFQRDKLIKETGGNIAAYKSKTLDDALKDPAFLAKAVEAAKAHANGGNGSRPANVQLPPSLNKVASAARASGDDAGDMSDHSLFRHALAR